MMDKGKTEMEIDHWCVVCDRQIVPAYKVVQPNTLLDPVTPVNALANNATINFTKANPNITNTVTGFTTADSKPKSKPKLTLAGAPPKALKSTTSANADANANRTPTTPTLNNAVLPPVLPKKRGSTVGAGNKGAGHRPALHRSRTTTGYGYATLAATAAATTKRKSSQTNQTIPSPNREPAPTAEVRHHEHQEPLMNGGITASPLEKDTITTIANASNTSGESGRKRHEKDGPGARQSAAPPLRRGYSDRHLPKDSGNQLLPFEKLPRKVNLAPMEGDPPAPPHNTVDDGEIVGAAKPKAQARLKATKSKPKSPLSPRYASKPASPLVSEPAPEILPVTPLQEVYEDPGKRLYCSEECRTADITEKQRSAREISPLGTESPSPSLKTLLYDMPWMESRRYNFTRIHSPTAASSRAPTRPASSTSLFDDERFTTIRTPPIGALWSFEKEAEEKRRKQEKRYSQPLPLSSSRLGSSAIFNAYMPYYDSILDDSTPSTPTGLWDHLDATRSLPVSPGGHGRPTIKHEDGNPVKKEQSQLQFRRVPGALSSLHPVERPLPRTRSYLSAGSPTGSTHARWSRTFGDGRDARKEKKRHSLMSHEYFPEGELGTRYTDWWKTSEEDDWPLFLVAADRDPGLCYEQWKEYRNLKRMELAAEMGRDNASEMRLRQPPAQDADLNKKLKKVPFLIRAASQPNVYHAPPRTRYRREPSKSSSRSRGDKGQELGTSVQTTSSIASPLEMKKSLPSLPPVAPAPAPTPDVHASVQSQVAAGYPAEAPSSPNTGPKVPNLHGSKGPVLEAPHPSQFKMEPPSISPTPSPTAPSAQSTAVFGLAPASSSISERRRAKNPNASIPLLTDNLPTTTVTTAANNPNRLSLTGLPPVRSPLGLHSFNAEEAGDNKQENTVVANGEDATKMSSALRRESSILAGHLRALQPLVIKAHIAVKCPPTSITSPVGPVGLPALTVHQGGDEKAAMEAGTSPTLITAISGSGSSGQSSMSRSAEARYEQRKLVAGRTTKPNIHTTLPSESQVDLTVDMSTAPVHIMEVKQEPETMAAKTPAQASLSKAYLDHLGSMPETTILGRWKMTIGGRGDGQGEKRRSLWGIFGSTKP